MSVAHKCQQEKGKAKNCERGCEKERYARKKELQQQFNLFACVLESRLCLATLLASVFDATSALAQQENV